MSNKQRKLLGNFNRVVIFALTVIGLLMGRLPGCRPAQHRSAA